MGILRQSEPTPIAEPIAAVMASLVARVRSQNKIREGR